MTICHASHFQKHTWSVEWTKTCKSKSLSSELVSLFYHIILRMAKENLDNLGFNAEGIYVKNGPVTVEKTAQKEEAGFVAGLGVKTSGKWGWN